MHGKRRSTMSISTLRVKSVPGGPVRAATAVLVAVLALVLASSTEAASPDATEATASRYTTTEAKIAKKKHLRELRRDANTWASLFAVKKCNRYMGQDLCGRISPASAAFYESFADATIEGIRYMGIEQVGAPFGYVHLAAVTYSNGVVVVFLGGRPEVEVPVGSCAGSSGDCTWNLAAVPKNRRFIQAARASATG
jgi:hypothetical protein